MDEFDVLFQEKIFLKKDLFPKMNLILKVLQNIGLWSNVKVYPPAKANNAATSNEIFSMFLPHINDD